MATMVNPLIELKAWLQGSVLPTANRLLWADVDTIDEVLKENKKLDNQWFLMVSGIDPNQETLMENLQLWHLSLSGVWSATKDPVEMNRIGKVVAAVLRKVAIVGLLDGVESVEVSKQVIWTDRFGATVAEIPLAVLCKLEEV